MAHEVDSEVILNETLVKKLERAAIRALEQTGEVLHTEVVQATVVPRDTGNLQNEAFFIDNSQSIRGEVSLVFSTPYARRLYYHPEYHFHKEKNPNAKGKWLEDWISGEQRGFAEKAFAELYRKEAGL